MLHTLMSPTCVSLSSFPRARENWNGKRNNKFINLNEIFLIKEVTVRDVDVLNELCMQQLAVLLLPCLPSGRNAYNTSFLTENT